MLSNAVQLMDPDIGYHEARKLLLERFGNQFVISKAWIQKITEGPPVKYNDNVGLRKYADAVRSCVVTLESMGRMSEVDNQIRMGAIVGKLPQHLQRRWRKQAVHHVKIKDCYPDISKLVEFIEMAAEEENDPVFGSINVQTCQRDNKAKPQKVNFGRGSNFNVQATLDSQGNYSGSGSGQGQGSKFPPCKYCSGNHAIYICDKFKHLNISKRLEFVRANKLCFNCFSSQHMSYSCTKPSKCHVNGCVRKHSRLLHVSNPNNEDTAVQSSEQAGVNVTSGTQTLSVNNSMCGVNGAGLARVALPIVPVVVNVDGGKGYISTFALLDSGSTSTFCSEMLMKRLGFQGTKTTLSLTTLTGEGCKSDTRMISLDIADVSGRQLMHLPHVFVVPKLPILRNNMVTQVDVDKWPHLEGVHLPTVDHTNVELLIGQDVPMALTPLEIRRGQANEPYATRTAFGWSLNGPLTGGVPDKAVSYFVQAEEILQKQIEMFWKLDGCDSLADDVLQMSVDDRRVVETWNETLEMKNGHYQMSIPFNYQPLTLPSNYCVAEARLESLKRRLSKDDRMHERYKSGIQDLLNKGYAEKVSESEMSRPKGPVWYLPHHSVINENKPEKLRIVFDCAAKYNDTSLNDVVLPGPDLTNPLLGVLLRFREERVAIMADIEAMFHQVKVSPKDRDVLRFLWWPCGDLSREPEVCRMTVHLFGGVWSPSCASFAVRRTAQDNAENFDPITIQTVENNFYVDDCLKSVASEDEAIRLVKQLRELLMRGGFRLTKWMSNSREVLETIDTDDRAKSIKDIDLNCTALPSERALGVQWNVETDELGFKVRPKQRECTRRGLISVISSIYDPLGFICPVILRAKMIFQNECRLKKSWDDSLEENNVRKWTEWLQQLPDIEQLTVDRCYIPVDFGVVTECQLHHFADASMEAYGSVSFLRLKNLRGQIHCVFLIGKSRLAPIKQITIPRLELSAAVVAAKLDNMLRRELTLKVEKSVFWTDSMVVLQYIKNETKRFQTFVANRVVTIRAITSPNSWRHVASKRNPADDASRGLTVNELMANDRWIHGPDFLWQEETLWPESADSCELPVDDVEIKREAKVCVTTDSNKCAICLLIERNSSWYKLKTSVAWILRLKQSMLYRIRRPEFRLKMTREPLTVQELKAAELEIVKFIQRKHFPEELDNLMRNPDGGVKKSSPIYKLEPLINADGVLCVGGRLQAAPISDSAKHQMILPKSHHAVTLIVRNVHESLGHSGREHVLSHLRQKFWIVRARTSIKQVLRNCVHCKRRQGPPGVQRMASLPTDRVTQGKPVFIFTGIDCFGPFYVKRGRIQVKRYGCIFTCLATRAVHVEKIDTMDTDSFLNALRRFECRRGRPEMIRSDNGSNFRSGDKELNDAILSWNQEKIQDYMRQKEIEWKYNPPTASHMGGVWERQIRTVRKILNALLSHETLEYESLNTLLCEVESIVNSRPITVVSDDPCDAEPLTPNHLLLMRSNVQLPPGNFSIKDAYRRRWKHVQVLADRFWKRWILEYLPILQLRQKWLSPGRNLCVGDVVLLMDENTPRKVWPLGKVVQTFPGRDGLVRAVDDRSRGNIFRRPIHKLCLLEPVTD